MPRLDVREPRCAAVAQPLEALPDARHRRGVLVEALLHGAQRLYRGAPFLGPALEGVPEGRGSAPPVCVEDDASGEARL